MGVSAMKRAVLAGGVLMILLVSVLTVSAFSFGKYEKVAITNGTVSVVTAKLADGKAHYYSVEDGGKTISFFAVKAADGSIKTAFDACDSCYRAKKGYEQLGDKMNCKNCNQKFPINRLGPNATGGCNPGYLPNKVIGSSVIIKAEDVKGGARYF